MTTSSAQSEPRDWGLSPCEFREPTAAQDLFFCRHPRVHLRASLARSEHCRQCEARNQPADKARDVPDDPLAVLTPQAPLLRYVTLEQLAADVRDFARQVPAEVTAIAGIPRSGLIPATLLAALLHLPLLELHREQGLRPLGHGLRLNELGRPTDTLLVVDDSVHGGWAMASAREQLRESTFAGHALFAAIYPRPESLRHVDLHGPLTPAPHLFEWNLFNCRQAEQMAFDIDGVLCDDWPGGPEEGHEYQEFLRATKPRWLPRRAIVPLIVTARLERHRKPTEQWLERHRVRYAELIMGPWESAVERRRAYEAGSFKGAAYARSRCTLFVESDDRQAEAIWRAAGKPVLCPSSGKVFW